MNKPDPTPRKFTNLLINPKFQLKLISYFIGLFLISTITLYSTTFLFFYRLKEKAINVGIPDGHIFFQFINNQQHDLDMLFLGFAGFNFILLIGVGFVISHRIAGPIYKLKTKLAQISKESEDFKLRESDFFQELEPVVNDLKNKIK